jgi:DNA-binding transcriptional regulator PaaX
MNNNTGKILGQTIGDLLIAFLSSGRNPVAFRQILRKRELNRYKKESIKVSLSRLNQKGYVTHSNGGWELSKNGKLYLRKYYLFSYIPSPFNSKSLSNTIISFDIPGPDRERRDWLRNQLKIFNYKMLQQSLWIGPGPLPPLFLNRLDVLKIRENIKFFKIQKSK